MSIQGVIDALHASCMKPACRASTCDALLCSRASTPGINSCISMEVATLRATCSLHAGFMSIAFSKCRSIFQMQPTCRPYAACVRRYAGCSRLHASCMKPACRAHASLVWTRHKRWASCTLSLSQIPGSAHYISEAKWCKIMTNTQSIAYEYA